MKKYRFSNNVPDLIRTHTVELLERWQFGLGSDAIFVEPLEGGLNNTNLILSNAIEKWVLKIRPDDFQIYGADSEASLIAQKACSKIGIAPKVLFSDEQGRNFISEFVLGVTLRPEYVRKNNLYGKIIDTLHVLHGIQSDLKERSFFDDIRLFMAGANKEKINYPFGFTQLLNKVYELERILIDSKAPKGFCHNDLVPQNFLQSDNSIQLVDFDYAGTGLIAADLASATSQFEMTEDEIESFLKRYDNELDDGQRGRLTALRFCNNIREISFTLFAEPLLSGRTATNDEINYQSHRKFNLEQAEQAMSDPSFVDKCSAASSVRSGSLF